MQVNNINTHNLYKTFIDADFTEKQAEVIMDAFDNIYKFEHNIINTEITEKVKKSEVKTEYDIMLLRRDIKELDTKLETRIKELDNKLEIRIKELDTKLETRIKELELRIDARLKDNLLKMYFAIGTLGATMLGLLPYIIKHF